MNAAQKVLRCVYIYVACAIRCFLRCIDDVPVLRRRKYSSDGKFLETTNHHNRLSRKPLCHIYEMIGNIAFDDQFWVTTLPYHEQVLGSYCL